MDIECLLILDYNSSFPKVQEPQPMTGIRYGTTSNGFSVDGWICHIICNG